MVKVGVAMAEVVLVGGTKHRPISPQERADLARTSSSILCSFAPAKCQFMLRELMYISMRSNSTTGAGAAASASSSVDSGRSSYALGLLSFAMC